MSVLTQSYQCGTWFVCSILRELAVSNLGQPLFCLSITWSRYRNAYRDLWIVTIKLVEAHGDRNVISNTFIHIYPWVVTVVQQHHFISQCQSNETYCVLPRGWWVFLLAIQGYISNLQVYKKFGEMICIFNCNIVESCNKALFHNNSQELYALFTLCWVELWWGMGQF